MQRESNAMIETVQNVEGFGVKTLNIDSDQLRAREPCLNSLDPSGNRLSIKLRVYPGILSFGSARCQDPKKLSIPQNLV